ncbi:MAG: hypothetical protein LBD58_06485 [Treponema sp.]|nr:hypothetical protein [Treponema sp.]
MDVHIKQHFFSLVKRFFIFFNCGEPLVVTQNGVVLRPVDAGIQDRRLIDCLEFGDGPFIKTGADIFEAVTRFLSTRSFRVQTMPEEHSHAVAPRILPVLTALSSGSDATQSPYSHLAKHR